jgi:xanthine dehydrogenase large subunit
MPKGGLFGFVVTSPHAHARVVHKDGAKARTMKGVRAVLFAEDIPGEPLVGPVQHDEPLLAQEETLYVGHGVALVVAESPDRARKAALAVEVTYEPLPACLTIADALAQKAFLAEPHVIERGDIEAALKTAPVRVSGEIGSGAQDHFYLETQASLAVLEEDGGLLVQCSTQHPSEVQATVAHVLGIARHKVRVEVPRMGGGFGGKETQAAPFAALAALGAVKTGRAVKVWLNRDQDMAQTGKRHPFYSRFDAGLNASGVLQALKVETYANGGFSADLSPAIVDRALFHLDNAYFIPNLRFMGRPVRTHLPSNTAFRGFGGPQGMLVVEHVLNLAAEKLALDPAEVRRRNFYGPAPRNLTPYGQEVKDCRLDRLHAELMASADYQGRKEATARFNRQSKALKRGLAFAPVKFGISFTNSFLNQAGALVLVYADGSVQLSHGGTEMGQGLHTKMLAVCAHELGVATDAVRVMTTATDKVPNTSATAASSGSDLNGQAVREACETLRERLRPVAARLLGVEPGLAPELRFEGGHVFHPRDGQKQVPFAEVAKGAHLSQVPMSATGFYKTPHIQYDRTAGRGTPFHYFAYGAAVVEVEVSGLTGEHRVRRVDILHDVGQSLVPTIDRGQIEGGFIQGLGWLTCEEALVAKDGSLLTHSPDTYKVPAVGEAPEDFRVELLSHAAQDGVIHGSKAVGEPPLMLALGVITALRAAIAAFGAPGGPPVELAIPCTPEAVFWAVERVRGAKVPSLLGLTSRQ